MSKSYIMQEAEAVTSASLNTKNWKEFKMSQGDSTSRRCPSPSRCTVDGCGRKPHAKGFCARHYYRWRTHGNPLYGGTFYGDPERFVKKVLSDRPSGCVFWPFNKTKGYACGLWKGRGSRIARVILLELVGDPPSPDMHAAHKCGNGDKGCIGPECLYWATPKENGRDRIEHGTVKRGEDCSLSRLTESDVIAIRIDPRSRSEIANHFNTSKSQVCRIKSRKSWGWLQ